MSRQDQALTAPDRNWVEQLESLQALATRLGTDTIVLTDPLNLSWFTGARWHVPQTLNPSCFDVAVSGLNGRGPAEVRIITNAIEAPRLRDTEFAGQDVVFDVVEWTENRASRVPSGPDVATDRSDGTSINAQAELSGIRRILTTGQRHLLTGLSSDLAHITGRVTAGIRPGQSEQHVAGALVAALLDEGIECVALFVGSDERIAAHRHPLATANAMRQRVMVACCGRRDGMVGTITRMASFVPLGPELQDYMSLLEVERRFLDLSLPGAVLGQLFSEGAAAYGHNGFAANEWRRHHQGGLTGFSPRELIATPDSDVELASGMVLGWNPSGAGFKVEDTVLVTDRGPEVLTTDDTWPTLLAGGRHRPAILEIT